MKYKCLVLVLVLELECSPMAWDTRVQSQGDSYQRLKNMELDAPLLNTHHHKVRIIIVEGE